MGESYSSPVFAVEQVIATFDTTASLASTVGATTLEKSYLSKAMNVTKASVYAKTGGTDAVRKLMLGYSLAGTGAVTALGTLTPGTKADGTIIDWAVTGTAMVAGDHLVLQHLGTGGEPWVVKVKVFGKERFV